MPDRPRQPPDRDQLEDDPFAPAEEEAPTDPGVEPPPTPWEPEADPDQAEPWPLEEEPAAEGVEDIPPREDEEEPLWPVTDEAGTDWVPPAELDEEGWPDEGPEARGQWEAEQGLSEEDWEALAPQSAASSLDRILVGAEEMGLIEAAAPLPIRCTFDTRSPENRLVAPFSWSEGGPRRVALEGGTLAFDDSTPRVELLLAGRRLVLDLSLVDGPPPGLLVLGSAVVRGRFVIDLAERHLHPIPQP